MLGFRACRLGLFYPEIYEMQVRAIVRAARAVHERTGEAPLVEIMHPLVGFGEELSRLRELTVRTAEDEGGGVEYLVGTMIELPRACVRADEIAEHADFFSFGTNDLTQTALGLSRDDAGRFLPHYLEEGILERDPFETIDQAGVGDLMRIAVERGRSVRPEHQARDLRRARRRGGERRLLPRARAGLRVVLAVPRPARAARRGAGGARRERRGRVRGLRRLEIEKERAAAAEAAAASRGLSSGGCRSRRRCTGCCRGSRSRSCRDRRPCPRPSRCRSSARARRAGWAGTPPRPSTRHA